MAESKHWQIASALRSGLAAIRSDGGTTYFYTPELVDLVSFYPLDMEPFAGKDVVYFLRPGNEEHLEEQSGDEAVGFGVSVLASFSLVVALRFEPSSENAGDQPEPSRPQIVDRLVRDVLIYLFDNVQLGGLVENINDGSLIVNRDMADAGKKWAMAEITFTVRYSYQAGTP